MAFIIDKQTLDDLNLLGKYKKNSAFSIFNNTHTRRGEQLLDNFFLHPMQDPAQIEKRASTIRFFQINGSEFPIDAGLFENVEFYINISASESFFDSLLTMTRYRLKDIFSSDKFYAKIQDGIRDIISILVRTRDFVEGLDTAIEGYGDRVEEMRTIFAGRNFQQIEQFLGNDSLTFSQTVRLDRLIRCTMRRDVEMIMDCIYEMDVYISVAWTASERGFCYPEPLPKEACRSQIDGLFHPALEDAVANDVVIEEDRNMFFLTGANMAGKSTFMKVYGMAVYLAHMGFPVPAVRMRFSVLDGMFTSINVPDNIALGYSHFYAEVLRVKHAVEHISRGLDMLIIFDELFKGTNVKDAYDATAAISEAFAAYPNCQFIISTHILEVADHLNTVCSNVQFNYFPTIMEGTQVVYPYKLDKGISADRHGMMIIANERIVEMIESLGVKIP